MKIRLLIISFDYRPRLGGVATCAYELASALSRQNIQVKIIAPIMEGDKDFDQSSKIETKRVSLSPSAFRSILKLKKEIETEINNFHPTLILDLLWMPDGIATMLSQKKDIPYFQITHGVEVIESFFSLRKILRSIFSPLKVAVFDRSKEVFCVSHFTKNLVQRYCHQPEDKIHVIFNGANPLYFYPKEKDQTLVKKHGVENKFVFLTIARLEDYKGIDVAIQAMSRLKNLNIPFKYLIGGIGPYQTALLQMIKNNHLEETVELIGKIPGNQLLDYYNLSNCFVTLSRDDYKTPNVEGFGLVFLEAALCKIPSVGGKSGGISDAIIDGKTGWIIDPSNISLIASTLESILKNPNEVLKRGQNAYERVISQMTWDHMAQRILTRFKQHVWN